MNKLNDTEITILKYHELLMYRYVSKEDGNLVFHTNEPVRTLDNRWTDKSRGGSSIVFGLDIFGQNHKDIFSFMNEEVYFSINKLITQSLNNDAVVVPQWFAQWYRDIQLVMKEESENDIIPEASKVKGRAIYLISATLHEHNFTEDPRVVVSNKYYKYTNDIKDNPLKYMEAVINGFVIEEDKFFAKIKGHELLGDDGSGYWNTNGNEVWIDYDANFNILYNDHKRLTKEQWNDVNINENNAVFVKDKQ